MGPHHLIILLYDSVTNSVFESQVLQPYSALVRSGFYNGITLISYENKEFFANNQPLECTQSLKDYADVVHEVRFLKKPLFFNRFFLSRLSRLLHKILSCYPEHTLIARGPISGYLAQHVHAASTQEIILQARGLLYEEYLLAHKDKPFFLKPLYWYRAQQYKKLEQEVYRSCVNVPTTLQAVSPALQDYLCTQYQPTATLSVATHDIPAILSAQQKETYRKEYRKTLSIDAAAPVYAYNGSLKPWQCPQETFRFFEQQWHKNPQAVLLFITQEQQAACSVAAHFSFPATAVRIMSLPHKEVVPALCAADYGVIFRQEHPINWTSRPTKVLEYQSAGLHIIHNNTIHILQNSPNSSYAQAHTIT